MDELIITLEHWQAMVNHIQSCLPEEACGLLAGVGSQLVKVQMVTNKYHSAVRFRMDEQELANAMADFLKQGLKLLAIYHSHPQGPSYPSLTDQRENCYPDSLSLIWFPTLDQWQCRAYCVDTQGYVEVAIRRC